jgi:hypothetical protein
MADTVSTTRFQLDPGQRVRVTVRLNGTPRSFVFDTARRHAAVSTAVAATLGRAVREDRSGVRVVDMPRTLACWMSLEPETRPYRSAA